jgi:EAL domain-containing protein (putative c-di-GMP-specific phosphodiesterase class I)
VVRPELVQVDLSRLGRASSPAVAAFLTAARGVGSEVMALGVDSPSHRAQAVSLGATLGRGRLLGEPGPLPSQLLPA